jgi:hypothetical protein
MMWMKQGQCEAGSVHAAEPSPAIFDGPMPLLEETVSVLQFKFTSLRGCEVFGHSS